MSAERILKAILTFTGAVLLTAAPFVFMPTSWMALSHEAIGLGEFPDVALTQYLTRSIAALYAAHGVLVLVAASDVRRYQGLIRAIAATDMAFGVTVLAIDILAGMPAWWILFEGPSLIGLGALVFALVRRVT